MKKIMFNDRYGLTEAVLTGRKTQTRRMLPDGTPIGCWEETEGKARYKVGEVVAVAQAYNDFYNDECDPRIFPDGAGWNNKMFVHADLMPHQIRIANISIERLQSISDEDCIKEGIYKWAAQRKRYYGFFDNVRDIFSHHKTPRDAYAALIDRISGKGTWKSNPVVFVYDFELVD